MFVGPHGSAGGAVASTESRRPGTSPAVRQLDPRRRASRLLLAAALVVGLAACTGAPAAGVTGASSGSGGPATSATGVEATAVPQAVPRSYRMSEAPHVVDRDAYAFRTVQALRPGATYRLPMPGN